MEIGHFTIGARLRRGDRIKQEITKIPKFLKMANSSQLRCVVIGGEGL